MIVAFLDTTNVHHQAADTALTTARRSGDVIASVVTFAEMLTGAELGHHDLGVVEGFFQRVLTSVIPVDLGIARRAAQLRGQRRSLKTPDALILATADEHADEALTADDLWSKLTGLSCLIRPI